jgi:hypothetical protein
VTNGLLFFGENRLNRIPISTCLTAVTVYFTDKDIGAFGICKWKVNNRYICTNAHNQIVTLDLNDGLYPEVAASTYVASKSCLPNCSECSVMAEVCQTTAPNTLNYWYGSYSTVSFFVNLLLGLPIK